MRLTPEQRDDARRQIDAAHAAGATNAELRVLIAVFAANVQRFDPEVHWPTAAWTHVDTWHRPEPGAGPLAGLCLRCDVPVSRHPARLR